MTTETVIHNDNILYPLSLYNCKLIAKLLGLKEHREDEVIESIRQSLPNCQCAVPRFPIETLFSGLYNLALVFHCLLKLNMKGPRHRNIISSLWVTLKTWAPSLNSSHSQTVLFKNDILQVATPQVTILPWLASPSPSIIHREFWKAGATYTVEKPLGLLGRTSDFKPDLCLLFQACENYLHIKVFITV